MPGPFSGEISTLSWRTGMLRTRSSAMLPSRRISALRRLPGHQTSCSGSSNAVDCTGMPHGRHRSGTTKYFGHRRVSCRRLPQLNDQYRALANVVSRAQQVPIRTLAREAGRWAPNSPPCSRCHGLDGFGRPSSTFPGSTSNDRLSVCAASGLCLGSAASGIMQPVAAELEGRNAPACRLLSAATGRRCPAQPREESILALGRMLMMEACRNRGCHPALTVMQKNFNWSVIRIIRLARPGIATILRLRTRPVQIRKTPRYAAADIMATIAERLTEPQIQAVAIYMRVCLRRQPRRLHLESAPLMEALHRRCPQPVPTPKRLPSWVADSFGGASVIVAGVAVLACCAHWGGETLRRRIATRDFVLVGGAVFPAVTLTVLLSYGLTLTGARVTATEPGALQIEVSGEHGGGGACAIWRPAVRLRQSRPTKSVSLRGGRPRSFFLQRTSSTVSGRQPGR